MKSKQPLAQQPLTQEILDRICTALQACIWMHIGSNVHPLILEIRSSEVKYNAAVKDKVITGTHIAIACNIPRSVIEMILDKGWRIVDATNLYVIYGWEDPTLEQLSPLTDHSGSNEVFFNSIVLAIRTSSFTLLNTANGEAIKKRIARNLYIPEKDKSICITEEWHVLTRETVIKSVVDALGVGESLIADIVDLCWIKIGARVFKWTNPTIDQLQEAYRRSQ